LSGIGGTATASYGYDYQGRRSSKTVSGSTTGYLYDGLNLVSESGAPSAYYLFGPGIDEPVAVSRGGVISYYATDALGSVSALTNSSGAVQNSYLYDAWGQTRSQTGSVPNPFTYTSREAGEAGTLFYRARYYNPSVGRFLAEDAQQYQRGPNAYAYGLNSPMRFTDPSGLIIKQCFRALKAAPFLFLAAVVSPPIPGNTACPMHEYLYNTDTGQSKGFDPNEDSTQETGQNICWPIPEPIGSCAWNKFESTYRATGPYNLLFHNCHHAIEDAKSSCIPPCTGAPPPISPSFGQCAGFGCAANR
jgi:RHS repeat-associated protein